MRHNHSFNRKQWGIPSFGAPFHSGPPHCSGKLARGRTANVLGLHLPFVRAHAQDLLRSRRTHLLLAETQSHALQVGSPRLRPAVAKSCLRLTHTHYSMSSFSDPKAISNYAESAIRRVPGLADVYRMTAVLLAESTPSNGQVLVVGAGGGMELKSFALSHPGWQFVGIDPSAEMLRLASVALGPLNSRVQLHQGYIDTARKGPFDSACSLLTLHFTKEAERYKTLCEIHARMKPGGVFVAMHYSLPQSQVERELWLSRCAAFATSSGVDAEQAKTAAGTIRTQLPILSPQQDEELMRKAGFSNMSTFYVALAFRGWVAHA